MIFQRRTGDRPLFSHSARLNLTPVALLEWVHSQRRKVPMRAKVRQKLYACATESPFCFAVRRSRCVIVGCRCCNLEGLTTGLQPQITCCILRDEINQSPSHCSPGLRSWLKRQAEYRRSRTLRGQSTGPTPTLKRTNTARETPPIRPAGQRSSPALRPPWRW